MTPVQVPEAPTLDVGWTTIIHLQGLDRAGYGSPSVELVSQSLHGALTSFRVGVSSVGSRVGSAVGAGVGLDVGLGDGSVVGFFDGFSVGLFVGVPGDGLVRQLILINRGL